MRKEIMQALQQEYEQQRLKNSQEEMRRRQEVITRCPEIGQYLAERQNLIFGGVRGILNGKAAANDLPARMDVMNKRIADLLRQSGFPADYLDPVYRCKQCRDTGYVGEPIREMCPCLRSAFYARLYREVGLGEKAEQSFAAFDPNVFSDKVEFGNENVKYSQRSLMNMIRHQCEQYAEKYPNAATMDLLLMGQSGLGKTYLMHAIAKRLLERGFNVMMISAYRFLDVARRAYFSGKQEEMDTLMDTDVLMIDDMGVEPLMENITIVQWFNLINERQLRGKGTVISTNLNVEELRRRGWRVRKADNQVLSGIRLTARLLKEGRLVICKGCDDAVREFSLYRWEDGGSERPVKEQDHAMDDLRYFVMYCEQEEKPGGFCAARVERTRR